MFLYGTTLVNSYTLVWEGLVANFTVCLWQHVSLLSNGDLVSPSIKGLCMLGLAYI